jgi:uncharacterized membrane protein
MAYRERQMNVGQNERIISAAAGGALIGYGIAYALERSALAGAAMGVAGAMLVNRGVSGHCQLYQSLGINTRAHEGAASVRHGQGIKVVKSVSINRSPEELFHFWRNFENLPRFMTHLKSVTQLDDIRSHWIVKGPLGMTVEWDAELYNEIEPDFIAWRSLENADVNHAGSVHFRRVAGGAEVRVELNYEPPAGKVLGGFLASLLDEEPGRQTEEDLWRLKHLIESGEVPALESGNQIPAPLDIER